MKFNCDIIELFDIKKIVLGSGGSSNIILDTENKTGDKFIIKIVPDIIYTNVKTKPDRNLLQIKFYQFFTQKYLLTNRTAHIVGIYNHQNCSRIDKFIKNIRPDKDFCPTYEDKLIKKMSDNHVNNFLCDLLLRYEMKLIGPIFDAVLLEHCEYELSKYIESTMNQIKNTNEIESNTIVTKFVSDLERILFQIIFTLGCIKEDYPGFMHGDFFVRNILFSIEASYGTNDYVAYHYKQKIFYLPANGIYAKINDFDLSIIVDELEPSTYKYYQNLDRYYHINPFNQKTDIFNLLHDIYDGENLGTSSINMLANKFGISFDKMEPIRNLIGKFIKVDVIDQINSTNRQLLNQSWHIDQIDILENTVRTPDEYLTENYFASLQKIPEYATIINHFNKPQIT